MISQEFLPLNASRARWRSAPYTRPRCFQPVISVVGEFSAILSGTEATSGVDSENCRGSAIDEARALGVDPVVVFTSLDFEALKGRFDVVFDTPSLLSFKQGNKLIKRGGVVIGTEPTLATMLRSHFTRRYKLVIGTQTPEALTRVAELTATGHLEPKIGRVVPLSEAIPAITELELKNKPDGKLVIVTT